MADDTSGLFPLTATLRRYGFHLAVGCCLAAYGALLLSVPRADQLSSVPEPADNPLYRANFPNDRGAQSWSMKIHSADPAMQCAGATGTHYRAVPAERCRNLLGDWGVELPGLSADAPRCDYYYASEAAARLGTGVGFVQLNGQCATRHGTSTLATAPGQNLSAR